MLCLFPRCLVFVLQDTVRQTFGECGDIKSVRFAEDRETGEFRGFGHVEFYDGAHVDAAMALANTDVMGRPIRVSVWFVVDTLPRVFYVVEGESLPYHVV